MRSSTTIRDVAAAAEFSISTVSRTMAHPELVASWTREHVLGIARDLRYRPALGPSTDRARPRDARPGHPRPARVARRAGPGGHERHRDRQRVRGDVRRPAPDHGRCPACAHGAHRRRPAAVDHARRGARPVPDPPGRADRPGFHRCRTGRRRPMAIPASATARAPGSRHAAVTGHHQEEPVMRPTLTRRTATVGLVAVGAATGLAVCSAPGSGGGESDDAPNEEFPRDPVRGRRAEHLRRGRRPEGARSDDREVGRGQSGDRLLGELRIRRRPVPRGPDQATGGKRPSRGRPGPDRQ